MASERSEESSKQTSGSGKSGGTSGQSLSGKGMSGKGMSGKGTAGGQSSNKGNFANDRDRAREAGRKGGSK